MVAKKPAVEDLTLADLQAEAEELRKRINRFRTSLGRYFVQKQEVIDLMVVASVAQEPLLLVGPPGTAKSDLVLKFKDALGIADEFRKAKLKIFGPTKQAARLEASKRFSKDIMARAGIRTARAKAFDQPSEALVYVAHHELPVVIKADGLAQGKGVLIAVTREEARRAIVDSMDNAIFGEPEIHFSNVGPAIVPAGNAWSVRRATVTGGSAASMSDQWMKP